MDDELNKLVWMNSEDAAKYLRVSKSMLHNLTSLGRIKYYKLGRSNRYYRKEIDELIFCDGLLSVTTEDQKKDDKKGEYNGH